VTPQEIRREGLQALLERLGPAGTLRFLQQCEPGRVNYTAERHKWSDNLTIHEILMTWIAIRIGGSRGMDNGMFGGIVGSVVGVAGGVLGTYCSIKKANGPRERSFIVKCAAGISIGAASFLAALVLMSAPYRWLLWILYGPMLGVAIVWMNRIHTRIRAREQSILPNSGASDLASRI
jgi:hypothetical protein